MRMMWCWIAIVLQNSIMTLVAGEPTAVVNTTTGPVQGQILKTVGNSKAYGSCKGIKYAESPVGYLHFKPPVPVKKWTEILNATVQSPECPQIDSSTNTVQGSEDCLYLNVHTPVTKLDEKPKKLKAVMVYIYGGDFIIGSTYTSEYGPDYLIDRGVVLVSMNYRIGALGFLNLNHPNATGNAGLKDQNLALRWVKKNIEQFGGDPRNVTLFGQSAGAASVAFHTVSDASAGLFHAAICMSGTTLTPWSFDTPSRIVDRAEKLGRLLGTFSKDHTTLLTTFYEASVEEIVRATDSVTEVEVFVPTLENATIATDLFISECTLRKYATGNFSKMRQMIGFMQQEAASMVHDPKTFFRTIYKARQVRDSPLLAKAFRQLTMAGNSSIDMDPDELQTVIKELSELLFIAEIDDTQRLVVENNEDNPVYYYHVTFDTDRSLHNLQYHTHIKGAGHADELGYILVFNKSWANYSLDLSDPVGMTIYRMSTMWTNFAKYGDPTPHWIDEHPLNVTWPESGQSGLAIGIGNDLTVGPRPIGDYTRLIQDTMAPSFPEKNGCC